MKKNNCIYKNYIVLILHLISSCLVFAQQKSGLANNNEPILITKGLQNEQLIRNIFLGKFLDIPFDRDEPRFSILLDVYVTYYGNYCSTNLPANKIELTYQECDEPVEVRNIYGVLIRTDCYHWATRGTGIYASPDMYYAKTAIDNLQTGDIFRTMFKMLKQENPVGTAANLVQNGLVMKQDIADLFNMNGCNSPGLKRFEENLRRFALNKQPIVLGGDSTQRSKPDILYKNQDFNKLVDDLINEQSTNWAVNRYERQSVSNVIVTSRDNYNRPAEIKANYQYEGWGGKSTGSVRITFTDGLPDCLYFFDFPTTCRTASRKIVTNYANGSYVNQQ